VKIAIDIVGWIGALGILAAYALVSNGRLRPASHAYQGLNLVGAIGLAINTWYYAAYPSTALNVVWAAIALYAIASLVRGRRAAMLRAPEP
jgi:hypothetical protein